MGPSRGGTRPSQKGPSSSPRPRPLAGLADNESGALVLLLPSRARSDSYDRVQVPRVRCVSALQSACSVSRRAYVRTRQRARSTRRRSGGGLRTPAASSLKRKRSSTSGRSANACTHRPRRRTRTHTGSWPPSRSRRSGPAKGGTRTRATRAPRLPPDARCTGKASARPTRRRTSSRRRRQPAARKTRDARATRERRRRSPK